eukprot:Selendium_serpulae@DN8125_c0_g1_i1.p1
MPLLMSPVVLNSRRNSTKTEPMETKEEDITSAAAQQHQEPQPAHKEAVFGRFAAQLKKKSAEAQSASRTVDAPQWEGSRAAAGLPLVERMLFHLRRRYHAVLVTSATLSYSSQRPKEQFREEWGSAKAQPKAKDRLSVVTATVSECRPTPRGCHVDAHSADDIRPVVEVEFIVPSIVAHHMDNDASRWNAETQPWWWASDENIIQIFLARASQSLMIEEHSK